MLFIRKLKNLVEHVPYGVGRWATYVPFSLRLGHAYTQSVREIQLSSSWNAEQRERYALEHFRKIFAYARDRFPCYRDLYRQAGVDTLSVQSFADIAKIPTIDKAWTRAHFSEFSGADKLNTGGSSGTPTPFWMDKGCWGREWAHFHHMWGAFGYKPTDLKLAIRGKNLGAEPYRYNPVHNEYIINTYLNVKDYASELLLLFQKRQIRWLHGYPSSIYQFILECEQTFGAERTQALFRNVRGLLLSSEFPHPQMKEKFAQYGLKYLSWYGHSEMAILAADPTGTNVYQPYVTYGLAEVVDGHLLGTSYHNFDMPLIRYDTDDLVEAVEKGDMVRSFAIREGRNGDFVEDRQGKKIPLTALIFGRHHRAFDIADYIQIGQEAPGRAVLYVSGTKASLTESPEKELAALFDLTGVDIDFEIKRLAAPIRTPAGKLCLRVPAAISRW